MGARLYTPSRVSNQLTNRCPSLHIGTCLPNFIIDLGKLVCERQSKVEDLSFVTSHRCYLRASGGPPSSTTPGPATIKRFSWSGPTDGHGFTTFQAFLNNNHEIMEELTFENIDHVGVCSLDQLLLGNESAAFLHMPALTKLHLTGCSLGAIENLQCQRALSLVNIKSLKLHGCSKVASMLEAIDIQDRCDSLETLELIADGIHFKDGINMITFLASQRALKNLYVMTDPTLIFDSNICPLYIDNWVLERLVWHCREPTGDDASDDDYPDDENQRRHSYADTELYDGDIHWLLTAFAHQGLECFGLCYWTPQTVSFRDMLTSCPAANHIYSCSH